MIRIIADTIEYDRRPVAKIIAPPGSHIEGSWREMFLEALDRAIKPEPYHTYETMYDHAADMDEAYEEGETAGEKSGFATGVEETKKEYAALVEAAQKLCELGTKGATEPVALAIQALSEAMDDLGL